MAEQLLFTSNPEKVLTSTHAKVAQQLMKTAENGKEGYEKGAVKLAESSNLELAATFRRFSAQRDDYYQELEEIAHDYGDEIAESSTVPAALHRGWMAVKDMFSGSDPTGVLEAAEQGEDHAVTEYDDALKAEISAEFRTLVQRQRLEYVERARGHLYSCHQLMGRADIEFAHAVELLAAAGLPVPAGELSTTLAGRNVLDGRWTFQVVDESMICTTALQRHSCADWNATTATGNVTRTSVA